MSGREFMATRSRYLTNGWKEIPKTQCKAYLPIHLPPELTINVGKSTTHRVSGNGSITSRFKKPLVAKCPPHMGGLLDHNIARKNARNKSGLGITHRCHDGIFTCLWLMFMVYLGRCTLHEWLIFMVNYELKKKRKS